MTSTAPSYRSMPSSIAAAAAAAAATAETRPTADGGERSRGAVGGVKLDSLGEYIVYIYCLYFDSQ